MRTIDTPNLADYVLDKTGQVSVNAAGAAVEQAFRRAENAYDALQRSWAGACLAGLFARHAWLQSLQITLSASAKYDDQGGSYRSVSSAVSQVLPLPGVAVPDSLIYDGAFDDVGAISEIEQDLDDFDHDLYLSINDEAGYDDVVLDLNRAAIADLLQVDTVSGSRVYRAWFLDATDKAVSD